MPSINHKIKSILAVHFCILLIAKSGNVMINTGWKGPCVFPAPYTHKASVSSIYKPLHE